MEKINISELLRSRPDSEDDRLGYMLCELIGNHRTEVLEKYQDDKTKDFILDVECKICGIDVSIKNFCDFLMGQFDRCVEARAEDKASANLAEMQGKFEEFVRDYRVKFKLDTW